MPTILDSTSDTSKQDFWRLAKLYPLPDYVKQASQSALEPAETLPTTAYADIVNKQFPCHTKAATYISWLYFLEKRDGLNTKSAELLEARLTNFSNRWGMAQEVAVLREKHAAAHRDTLATLPDSAFAIVWVDGSGSKARHLPMRNATEVKVAAEWFRTHRDSFKWDDRQTVACKLLDKAVKFGAALGEDLDDMLEKQAGRGVYVPSRVADMIENRTRAVDRLPAEVKERMLKLAANVKSNAMLSMDPATSANLARTLDMFDRSYGITGNYSTLVPRPEDVLFAGTLKTAGQFIKDACTLVTGSVYEKKEFAKLALSEVRALLGDAVIAAVADGIEVSPEKMAEVAETLPRPDAQKLEHLLSDIGVTPVFKNASAAGVSVEDQAGLAAVQDFLDQAPTTRS